MSRNVQVDEDTYRELIRYKAARGVSMKRQIKDAVKAWHIKNGHRSEIKRKEKR